MECDQAFTLCDEEGPDSRFENTGCQNPSCTTGCQSSGLPSIHVSSPCDRVSSPCDRVSSPFGRTSSPSSSKDSDLSLVVLDELEVIGRDRLRSPDLDSLGNDCSDYEDTREDQEAECLHRVLKLLGRQQQHRVAERGPQKYVIRKRCNTSYIYLAFPSKNTNNHPISNITEIVPVDTGQRPDTAAGLW